MCAFDWKHFKRSISIPVRIGLVMVLVFAVQESFNLDFGILGILPRKIHGLFGIVLTPFIHGNWLHLISNLWPFLILSMVLYYFYDRIAGWVIVYGMLWTNILVWCAGRPYLHIGSSGLVYMLAFFLMCFGFFRWKAKDLIISILVMMIYGSLVFGLVPNVGRVSWESHLLGAAVGFVLSFYVARKNHIKAFALSSIS
ncbi:rhomboid family intramembrane serine protease [Algoriphagus sediminis]|uniref:Rhomboid family intramembrane serine protease n=1 Tax=Algoriphagus sediminis TaxID=3057113 RepID=A0ABT7YAX3_9BACT|nr:rhomboid family intramembrane serine protease [Algoriphagus sediminis]MDN3203675.1 rhomboid family intramembrane serine protease [Algoriphagus sediminis]